MKDLWKTTSSCSFFSLFLVVLYKFSGFPFLLALSSFYSPPFPPFQLCLSQLNLGRYLSYQTSPCHFLIMKIDFWDVSIIQASHSVFNKVDIRQEQLINAEVTVTLGCASSSLRSSRMGIETEFAMNQLTASPLGYYISGQACSSNYLSNWSKWFVFPQTWALP